MFIAQTRPHRLLKKKEKLLLMMINCSSIQTLMEKRSQIIIYIEGYF